MKKIETDRAPLPIGPYSQAILAPPFLFLSGMLPIDPATSKITAITIEEQMEQVLKNIGEVLKEAGLTFKNVVRMEVYLNDLSDFPAMNAIYAKIFSHKIKPTRHTVEVSRLPLNALIEITCTAYTQSPS